MSLKEDLKNKRIYLDGSMGTMLFSLGLKPSELPERWNITHSDDVINIHKMYYDAGVNIVSTNTFGANCLKYDEDELCDIIKAAVDNAKQARSLSDGKQEKYIALDIGPLGKLLKPFGDFEYEAAIEAFKKTITIGVSLGVDLILIETMNDSLETKAAVIAAKECSDLPIFASNAYSDNKKLMTGASPAAMAAMLEGLKVDAIGANCSLGPDMLLDVVNELLEYSSVPVFSMPNAGLPKSDGEKTYFEVDADEFSEQMVKMAECGVNILGGCCGTTPEYIRKTVEKTKSIKPCEVTDKKRTLVSSYTHAVEIGNRPIIIGERINPTGKKRLKEALLNNDISYILNEGISQQERKADILDVNVGLPGIDEAKMLKEAVYELQAVIDLPLQIDTADISAMESALREYNGKAMINSVNGKEESMKAVFPLVRKYGGVVVALTLDENGIPDNASDRVKIADKIIKTAKEYGIDKKDIVFDTLCMSVSADPKSAKETLSALKTIRFDKKVNTVLGVSNISFGLPKREIINSSFFALALENGLSAAIINPLSNDMMKTYYSYLLLNNMDENCKNYIEFSESLPDEALIKNSELKKNDKAGNDEQPPLINAIIKGLRDKAGEYTKELLKKEEPLNIISLYIVPALNIVGKGFEEKRVYLPQLLMSAETAQKAFVEIKKVLNSNGENAGNNIKFVLATVKGDVHDIGKNIVKVLLENYGFNVIDLGKDVPPEVICDTVIKENAPICGLSALMTTTVPAMEETIKLLKKKAPCCKTVVGGAVLTKEYAEKIGADMYAKDAMETVRYAQSV